MAQWLLSVSEHKFHLHESDWTVEDIASLTAVSTSDALLSLVQAHGASLFLRRVLTLWACILLVVPNAGRYSLVC